MESMANFARYDVLGVPVSAVSLELVYSRLTAWSSDGQAHIVTFPDVSNVVRSRDYPELRAVHLKADVVAPDGMPLVWLGKLRGLRVSRTCGPDFFAYAMSQSRRNLAVRHYFLGGKPQVAERLRATVEGRYPGVVVVGTFAPPFSELTPAEIHHLAETIAGSTANVVWIGVSSPKQELLAAALADLVPATFLAVGAAFDFHSGAVLRAPKWMQRAGLEWIYRFAAEPGRLWKRYVILAPRFVWLVVKQGLKL